MVVGFVLKYLITSDDGGKSKNRLGIQSTCVLLWVILKDINDTLKNGTYAGVTHTIFLVQFNDLGEVRALSNKGAI